MSQASSTNISSSYAVRFLAEVCREQESALRILRQLYPDGAKCASCGASILGNRAKITFWRGERTYCAACNCKFTPTSGTILADARLTFDQFEMILVLLSLGIGPQQIATLTTVHPDTVAAWSAKIRFWESHV